MQGPDEVTKRYKALKAKFPDASDEELFAFLDEDMAQSEQRLGTVAPDASAVAPPATSTCM